MGTTKRPNQAPASHDSYTPEGSSKARFWSRIEVWIAVFTTSAILLHLAARFALRLTPAWYLAPLYAVLILGGLPLLVNLSRRVLARDFGSDLIAGVSIVTAVILGEIVVLMLSGGAALEQY